MMNLRAFSTTLIAQATAAKSAIKAPVKAKKSPISGGGKKGPSPGSNDSRNQVIKQILYDKEHEIAAERRRIAAMDAARVKKRLSPVEYARDQNDPEQVSREEKDFIERVYSLYKQDEFKKDFDKLTRHSLSIVNALQELQKLDSNLFERCFQPLPRPLTGSNDSETSASSSSSNTTNTSINHAASNQQVALDPDSAPLPLFPRRMRIPAETLAQEAWDYEMKPPLQ